MLTLHVDDQIDLRTLETAHAAPLFRLIDRNRAHLREWLPWVDGTKTVRDTRRFVRQSREGFRDNLMVQTGIWSGDEMLGAIGLNRVDTMNRRAHVGYWIDREHEGRGIVTRACFRLIRYGFEQLDLNKIEILCEPRNARSRAVPERLGFVIEGTLREAQWINGHFVDLVVYGMLLTEYWAKLAHRP